MPHLDEGTIHAYLDGELPLVATEIQSGSDAETQGQNMRLELQAVQDVEQHLSECAECRVALDHAREIKQAAASMLSSAGPVDVQMPSFTEVEARAKETDRTTEHQASDEAKLQRRRYSRMRPLAWAATIVLAAAVGWYARSSVLSSRPGAVASEEDAGGRLTLQVPQTTPSVVQSRDSAADIDELGNAAEAVEEETRVAVGGVDVAPRSPSEAEAVREQAEHEPPKGVPEPTVDIPDVVRADSGERPAIPVRQADRRGRLQAPQARQVSLAEAAAAPTMIRVAGADAAETWRPVDEAEAESILQRQVPIIEGLEVSGYAVLGSAGQRAVRIQQTLGTSEIIELIVVRGGLEGIAEADNKRVAPTDIVAGEETSTINTIVLVLGDLNIRISAALTTDSLRALSDKISAR